MNQQINEKLSALMDDELPKQELTAVLDRLSVDPEQKALWDRYHLIGDAVRGEAMRLKAQGISQRVSAVIAEEPTVLSPGAAGYQQPHWVKPAVGSAIAASVAVLAILAAPQFISEGDTDAPPAVANSTAMPQVKAPALASAPALAPAPALEPAPAPAMLQPAPQMEVMPASVVEQRVPARTLEVAAQAAAPLPMERLYEVRSVTRWDVTEPALENKLNSYLVTHQEYAPATNITGMLPYATFVGYDSRK